MPNPNYLSPRMAEILERMRRAQRPTLHTLSVEEARLFYEQGAEVLDLPRAALPRVEPLRIPVGQGVHIAARLYVPSTERLPVVLYFHGGGFVIGSLETHDSLCRQLALQSHAAVLAVDYRLAPEHRFPVAVQDAWAALQWTLQASPHELNLDTARVVVAGDSAGAALAAVAALHARDQGWTVRGQVLITPHAAAQADTPSRQKFATGFLLDAATIAWLFDHYADPTQRFDWRFAPLLAETLDGVAPTFMVLAECDPLVDEGLLYADALRAAGNVVELELVRGVTHEFIKMGRLLPEARAVQQRIGEAVRRFFL